MKDSWDSMFFTLYCARSIYLFTHYANWIESIDNYFLY